MSLEQFIEAKFFLTNGGQRAILVNDMLSWMLGAAVSGALTFTPDLVDGKENTNER
jgi:hypothetical protein